jgi:hypothetical protein
MGLEEALDAVVNMRSMSDGVLVMLDETLTLRLGYRQIPSACALPGNDGIARAPVNPDRALAVYVSPLCARREPGFMDVAIFRMPAVQRQDGPQDTTFCTSPWCASGASPERQSFRFR